MRNLLVQLLNNLQNLIKADFVLLAKHHQDKLEIINFIGDEVIVSSIVENNMSSKKTEWLENIINKLTKLKYASSLYNTFGDEKNTYLLISATKEDLKFDEYKIRTHNEISKSVEFLLKDSVLESDNNLLAKQDYFHLFASVSSEIVFTLDQQGIFTFLNEQGQNELQYNSDEILGKHFFEIVHEDSKLDVAQSFQEIVDSKNKTKFKSTLFSKIGNENLYEVTLIPLLEENKLASLLGIAKNISSYDKAETINSELKAKLTEADRINAIERDRALQKINVLSELNNLKNEFISNVSHELRTPLASIVGFAETIAEDKNLTLDSIAEFNEVILSESKRLAKLINDVLDFSDLESKKQELKLNSKNVIELVKDSLSIIREKCEENQITLTEKVPESEIIISVDEERLKKALNHLLANAVKFTKKSGRITVIVQEFLKEVEIVISDTGVGIPEEKKPLLFNKFSKASKIGNSLPGAGFGLATVKQIIDLHKGLINVKSEVNKGTSFIIKLPKYSFN